jgi:hypothetical protein
MKSRTRPRRHGTAAIEKVQVLTPARPRDRAIQSTQAEAESRLGIGWAAKLVNVYLKAACYVGDLGTPALRDVLHPPVDAGLWSGISHHFRDRPDIRNDTHHVTRIRDIRTYDA